jgi:glutathione S-transferase
MKLYDTARAPNPRRVRWLMAEKGIEDIEIVPVDIMTGQHRTSEYKAKAGQAHVPALELDDGTVFTESIAICRYLESLHPEPNLFGRDPVETAQIEVWTRRCELYLANPLMMAVRLSHPALPVLDEPSPEVSDHYRGSAERMLARLDRQLAGREFIAADRVTMADVVAVTGMDFARLIRWRPPAELAELNRWYEAMRARPAAAAGLEAA